MRAAYFASYRPGACEFVKLDAPELDARLKRGPELVAADFVIPYPPGFPIMVPGQVITQPIIDFMRKLDVKEIHGYHADARPAPAARRGARRAATRREPLAGATPRRRTAPAVATGPWKPRVLTRIWRRGWGRKRQG